MKNMLNIALPKGRLGEKVYDIFAAAGYECPSIREPNRKLIFENEAAGVRKKPAPDTVDEALRRLGADRRKAVYVGDSDVDILTARNAQLPCISVLWGFRDRQFLLNHGATTFASKPEEIINLGVKMPRNTEIS